MKMILTFFIRSAGNVNGFTDPWSEDLRINVELGSLDWHIYSFLFFAIVIVVVVVAQCKVCNKMSELLSTHFISKITTK